MNNEFLEFWGNLLINVAKGQRKMEEVNSWINQGLKGSEELSGMILSFYGVNGQNEDALPEGKAWEKLNKSFLEAYREYIKLIGMVPKTEYDNLAKKYEDLEHKCKEQEEYIRHLEKLTFERTLDPSKAVKDFQELISNQSKQFNKLMQGFNKVLDDSKKGFAK